MQAVSSRRLSVAFHSLGMLYHCLPQQAQWGTEEKKGHKQLLVILLYAVLDCMIYLACPYGRIVLCIRLAMTCFGCWNVNASGVISEQFWEPLRGSAISFFPLPWELPVPDRSRFFSIALGIKIWSRAQLACWGHEHEQVPLDVVSRWTLGVIGFHSITQPKQIYTYAVH